MSFLVQVDLVELVLKKVEDLLYEVVAWGTTSHLVWQNDFVVQRQSTVACLEMAAVSVAALRQYLLVHKHDAYSMFVDLEDLSRSVFHPTSAHQKCDADHVQDQNESTAVEVVRSASPVAEELVSEQNAGVGSQEDLHHGISVAIVLSDIEGSVALVARDILHYPV